MLAYKMLMIPIMLSSCFPYHIPSRGQVVMLAISGIGVVHEASPNKPKNPAHGRPVSLTFARSVCHAPLSIYRIVDSVACLHSIPVFSVPHSLPLSLSLVTGYKSKGSKTKSSKTKSTKGKGNDGKGNDGKGGDGKGGDGKGKGGGKY